MLVMWNNTVAVVGREPTREDAAFIQMVKVKSQLFRGGKSE